MSNSEIACPVSYEVTAQVRPDLIAEWLRYMEQDHIPALIETGCFGSATITTMAPGHYRTQYLAPSAEALNDYHQGHAARLRADTTKHFPEGIEYSREEWQVVAQL